MKKALKLTRGDLAVIAVVVLSALLCMVLFVSSPGSRAAVAVDGKTVLTFSLAPDGYGVYVPLAGVTVTVDETGVRVSGTDCPDRLCMGRGSIARAGESIICVPHRLIITVQGSGEVDGIAG